MYRRAPADNDGGMPLSIARAGLRHGLCIADPSATEARWPTIYVDTSVVSYLTARLSQSIPIARNQRLTRVWWHRYRENHACCISDLVLTEAAAGDAGAADERLQALRGIVALRLNPEARSLARQLIGGGLLPRGAVSDAEHIALAATNAIRILLTWNCRHLANESIRAAVARMCEACSVRCPEICTPEQLMRRYEHERPAA